MRKWRLSFQALRQRGIPPPETVCRMPLWLNPECLPIQDSYKQAILTANYCGRLPPGGLIFAHPWDGIGKELTVSSCSFGKHAELIHVAALDFGPSDILIPSTS